MTSLREWMRSACFACCLLAGCGITIPGSLDLGIDDPGVIGTAGSGGRPVVFAGNGAIVAGRSGGAAAGSVGTAGRWAGGASGTGIPWGGVSGTGVAGQGGGYAGTGNGEGYDFDGDGWDQYRDCNETNFYVHPGAVDTCCDGIDNDCDGRDSPVGVECKCAPPPPPPVVVDRDGDGWTVEDGDCNDSDGWSYPGAQEDCFDDRDSNCDGVADIDDWNCSIVRGQVDRDGDGYDQAHDCNDFDYSVRPNATEICGDGIDNDCDTLVDPYPYCSGQAIDWDHDGYPSEKDCNDGDASVFPGSPYEKCCDGVDSNCDGWDGIVNSICTCPTVGDGDGDGFGIGMSDPTLADCNDQDATVHPKALEDCSDMRDNDCDGLIDGADPDCWVTID